MAAHAMKRRWWPIRVYRLGQEPGDDLSATTTPEARLAMMWSLALEGWTLASRPMPDYRRAETAITIRRLRR
jgi:hypothetical protein